MTGTWNNSDKGMDFELDGYELWNINRQNKDGGEIAVYADKTSTCKVVDDMPAVNHNVFILHVS